MTIPSLSRQCRLVARAACAVCGLALVVAGTPSVALAIRAVPEIDAGTASSALAVLSGGVLLLTDRLLRRKA
jgi:hypothetical protein